MKKKRNVVWILLLVTALFISGCGASAKDEATADVAYEESMSVMEMSDAESGTTQAETITDPNRKLIKRQYLTVETLEFDGFTALIKNKTDAVGGYIENSSVSGTSYYSSRSRYANYTVRIPAEKLDEFVNGIKSECNVTNFSEEVEDITLNYIDTESRIEALQVEQESLTKMLAEATELDTILAIQNRLTEVRYELQSYESQMRIYDNEIDYSTVYLDVYEVERETSKDEGSFGTRLKERLSDNLYSLGNNLEGVALFFLGGLPYWMLLALIAAIVILIVKKVKKRREAEMMLKKTLKSSEMQKEITKEIPKDDMDE